jgi:TetR/AcrR family transcriptional regulator, repressor of the ameABC operon
MARPKPDETDIRAQILETAEALLARHGSGRVTVSEIAAACGMSQSNAYRYFGTKACLMSALAARWFESIEAAMDIAARKPGDSRTKLRSLLKLQFTLKLSRHDQNPELFRAYLDLAAAHPHAITGHVERIDRLFGSVIGEIMSTKAQRPAKAARMHRLIMDATLLIRDPYLITRFRSSLTADRVDELIELALGALPER